MSRPRPPASRRPAAPRRVAKAPPAQPRLLILNKPFDPLQLSRQLAEIRGLSVEAIADATRTNFWRLFNRVTPA